MTSIVSVVSIPGPRYFDRKCTELNGDSDWFWKLKSCFSRLKDFAALHLSDSISIFINIIDICLLQAGYKLESLNITFLSWTLERIIWKGRLVKPEWKSENWTNWSEPMRLEVVELQWLDKKAQFIVALRMQGHYCCALHCLQRVGEIGGELGSD